MKRRKSLLEKQANKEGFIKGVEFTLDYLNLINLMPEVLANYGLSEQEIIYWIEK